jgi:hypothetical protein
LTLPQRSKKKIGPDVSRSTRCASARAASGEPSRPPEQVERMQRAMWNALAAPRPPEHDVPAPKSELSFAAEWLELLRLQPAANGALVAAAAVLLATPLSALPWLFR